MGLPPNDDALLSVEAKPYAFSFPPGKTALLIIDMQKDFLLESGFGDIQGGDLAAVQASIEPAKKLLEACRAANLSIFHTREGQRPDLSDCPSSKLVRQAAAPGNTQHKLVIGDKGKMGRLLVRGEHGHDIVDELKPLPSEVVIDKPGKGAFWNTELMHKLKARGATHILVAGVTTECCVSTTFREANDRGFECCAVTEATAGYNDSFKDSSLDMLHWSQGLFGFVASLQPILDALRQVAPSLAPPNAETPPHTPPGWDGDVSISALAAGYRAGLSPIAVIESLYSRIDAYETVNPGSWIYRIPKEEAFAAARQLAATYSDRSSLPPLFGIPFTAKDSIDVAGIPTTTACPPLTHVPTESAPIYLSVIAQGAIFLGKANLDQLATGLSGQRSPYGAPSTVFHQNFISGGSSSGSAVHVGAKLCSFSLATDTAGSGRVPSSFNGVVGYKPTRGTVPFVGITPACLSLDCVALIAASVTDARTVWQSVEAYDDRDPYAKPLSGRHQPPRHVNSIGPQAAQFRFGIPPPDVLAVCAPVYQAMFGETVRRLQRLGGRVLPVDWSIFQAAGDLLYNGSFVCERLASLPGLPGSDGSEPAAWLQNHKDELHPVIHELFAKVVGRRTSAADVFADLQCQARLVARVRNEVFTLQGTGVDVVVVPTAPTHFTVEEIRTDPIRRNSFLGTFTHAGNVLDLCAIACPAGKFAAGKLVEGEEGQLPFGVTLLGGSGTDSEVLEIARRLDQCIKRETCNI